MTDGFEYWQAGEQPLASEGTQDSFDRWMAGEQPVSLSGAKTGKPSPPGKPPPKPRPIPPGKLMYRTPIGNLAAWWPANASAGSTTWYDVIGNNDAPMTGTVPWALLGPEAFAADFLNNSANYFNAGSSGAICDADMSIACWCMFDAPPTTAGQYDILFARNKAANESYLLGVYCNATGQDPRVWWRVGAEDMFIYTGPGIIAGYVYHIVVTGHNGKGPGSWDLYVNGQRVGVSTETGAIPYFATNSYIGRREEAGGEGAMDGKVFDLRVYDRPLTPPEVAYLYGTATRWDLYAPRFGILQDNPPIPLPGGAGGALSGLSALTGLSAIMGS